MRFTLLAALALGLASTPAEARPPAHSSSKSSAHARPSSQARSSSHARPSSHSHASYSHARPSRTVVVRPSWSVHLSPWTVSYAPSYRSGYVWVGGYHSHGTWYPGYWRPASARSGYAWVPGYWMGDDYYEGYWRPEYQPGYAWVDGYYDGGYWVEGYWAPSGSVSVSVGHVGVSVYGR